uniref:AT14307p n=1 Tax=Drosophila melanogaster TaxID=7227 RepID=Q8T461_DROME|nr:AT14307p [Drosophila melanogaster]
MKCSASFNALCDVGTPRPNLQRLIPYVEPQQDDEEDMVVWCRSNLDLACSLSEMRIRCPEHFDVATVVGVNSHTGKLITHFNHRKLGDVDLAPHPLLSRRDKFMDICQKQVMTSQGCLASEGTPIPADLEVTWQSHSIFDCLALRKVRAEMNLADQKAAKNLVDRVEVHHKTLQTEEAERRKLIIDKANSARNLTIDKANSARILAIDKATSARKLTIDNSTSAGTLTIDKATTARKLTIDKGTSARKLTIDKATSARKLTIEKATSARKMTIDKAKSTRNLTIDNATSARKLTIEKATSARKMTIDKAKSTRNLTIDNATSAWKLTIEKATSTRKMTIDKAKSTRNLTIDNATSARKLTIEKATSARRFSRPKRYVSGYISKRKSIGKTESLSRGAYIPDPELNRAIAKYGVSASQPFKRQHCLVLEKHPDRTQIPNSRTNTSGCKSDGSSTPIWRSARTGADQNTQAESSDSFNSSNSFESSSLASDSQENHELSTAAGLTAAFMRRHMLFHLLARRFRRRYLR